MKTRPILCAVIVVALASLACNALRSPRVKPTPGEPLRATPADAIPTDAAPTEPSLAPLDRRDRGSALRWLLYALEQRDLEAFRMLTAEEFQGYANYIEGGDPVSREKFLQDLEARLSSSQVTCTGYEGDDHYIRVWTTGWSPPWEMTQICYDGCNPLEPPYQSSEAGFFLYNLEGEWWLRVNYVNTPEKYYFSPYTLTPCSQPE